MGAGIVRSPKQTELMWIEGSPEGLFFGPVGFVVIDQDSGSWYRKTTPQDQNTGWQLFSSSAPPTGNVVQGIFITNGLPTDPPPITGLWALAYDVDADVFYVWIVPQQRWK